MLISEKSLQHWINHFYGYGSWTAKFWFVGYEENGGDLPEEVAEKFGYFDRVHASAKAPVLCDLRELYRDVGFRISGPRAKLFNNFYDHRFGKDAVQHGFWKNMTAFIHGYKNKTLPDLLAYQKKSFATSQEALIQLYPLPAHNHAWYYGWLDIPQLPFLKTRAAYEAHVYTDRIQNILQSIDQHKPEVVVMYGMENINALKQSVQEVLPAKFKTMKAVKRIVPQHHRADVNGTTLIITTQIPGLRHGRVETGFDWYEFGKTVKANA
jgi:hypothetical protein